MAIDPLILPGLTLLAGELLALAATGYLVARIALRQPDHGLALAQGIVIGPAVFGIVASLLLYLIPGMAGAALGWVVIFAAGVSLAARRPVALRPSLRVLASVLVAALGLSWIALAGRQLLIIPDPSIHLTLSSAIRAGIHPPELPWNPSHSVPYHYGMDLLVGLLMPPAGPDLAFTTEVLGVYVWTGFALVVATTLTKRGSLLGALVLAPLILSAGTWTLLVAEPPALLNTLVPSGLPEAGLRTSLRGVYWPMSDLPGAWSPYYETPPPNIWKPPFPLAYALAFVVLERATGGADQDWLGRASLALLIGFLGIVEETVALTVLGLWLVSAILAAVQSQSDGLRSLASIRRNFSGPALALLLLGVGGGPLTGVLTGGLGGGLSLRQPTALGEPRLWGSFEPLAGGIGILSLGTIPVAASALVLGWRWRLVLALIVGSGVFALASLTLQFSAFQFDVGRLDGHARNFALLALVVALGIRLQQLRPNWRYAAAGGLVALIVWPTVATPVSKIRLALDRGVQLANARPALPSDALDSLQFMGRHVLEPFATEEIVTYIRSHTNVDTRILSPDPIDMSIHTGRPSAFGFADHVHLFPLAGPSYEDAIRFLEPAALRRLRVSYVHATHSWIADLPERAQRWLADPTLFTQIIRDGTHSLYRVEPAFLQSDPAPDPQSYEALRRVVPDSADVFMSAGVQSVAALRIAAALPHARLAGSLQPSHLYLLSEIPIDRADEPQADLVVVARDRSMNASSHAFPLIWWNHAAIAYATSPSVAAATSAIGPPPKPASNFVVRMSDVHSSSDSIAFDATFIDHASPRWTGQDWLVIAVERSPWSLPTKYAPNGHSMVGARWYAGQIVPSSEPARHRYEFDGSTQQLAVLGADGTRNVLQSSGDRLAPGTYVLAVRLRQDHLEAGIIPVLKLMITEDGRTSYETFSGDRGVTADPCPLRLQQSESCRRAPANS